MGSQFSETHLADHKSELPEWTIVEREGVKQLERAFSFGNFVLALAFTNQVGELAEAKDHHPSLLTEWGKVTVTWWTHSAGGILPNDFALAAETDRLYKSSL